MFKQIAENFSLKQSKGETTDQKESTISCMRARV